MIKYTNSKRRTRKDLQSRDFVCRCGKAYLSYAAVYTHIKKFHDFSKDYMDAIAKPQKRSLRPGRPKNRIASSYSKQSQLLNILETCILYINDALQGTFPEIILPGNREEDQCHLLQQWEPYSKLIRNKYSPFVEDIDKAMEQDQDLKEITGGLTKHFSTEVAVKIRFLTTAAYFQQNYANQPMNEFQGMIEDLNIWEEKTQLNSLIFQAVKDWTAFKRNSETQLDQQ